MHRPGMVSRQELVLSSLPADLLKLVAAEKLDACCLARFAAGVHGMS